MLGNIASCHRQQIGTFHAGTHLHKNQVKAEKALETFIGASNPANIKRVKSPANAILAFMAISVAARPLGNSVTRVANKGQGLSAANDLIAQANPNPPSIHGAAASASNPNPALHRREDDSTRTPSWRLIPGAHASPDEAIPMTSPSDGEASTGQQIEDIGQVVATTGFCGVVRRNPVGAIVVAGGAVVTAAGLLYKHLSSAPEAEQLPEDLPSPAALSSNAAVAIKDTCTNLIGQFSILVHMNIDQLMTANVSPIEDTVIGMTNIQLDGINRADLNTVGNCVGVDLRTSKVEPLIDRLVAMKRDVQEGTALSIDAPFSELRKIAVLSQLNSMLNSLRRINSNLYNLTANINRKFLDYLG